MIDITKDKEIFVVFVAEKRIMKSLKTVCGLEQKENPHFC